MEDVPGGIIMLSAPQRRQVIKIEQNEGGKEK